MWQLVRRFPFDLEHCAYGISVSIQHLTITFILLSFLKFVFLFRAQFH